MVPEGSFFLLVDSCVTTEFGLRGISSFLSVGFYCDNTENEDNIKMDLKETAQSSDSGSGLRAGSFELSCSIKVWLVDCCPLKNVPTATDLW